MQKRRTSATRTSKSTHSRTAKAKSKKRTSADKTSRPGSTSRAAAKGRAKVGSNPGAARAFGSKRDFGVPSTKAHPAGRSKDAGEGLPRNRSGRSVGMGQRVEGVGSNSGGPGAGSGGDLDPTFIGLDGRGLAQDPPVRVTKGPASSTGGSEEFASGGPAAGENQTPRVRDRRVRGTTFDRSGGDASTSGAQGEPE